MVPRLHRRKRQSGIANNVAKTRGSIGYVEYAYAKEANLSTVQLKNADGKFVAPEVASFAASASGADWKNAPNFRVELTNQKGARAWPITGVTYIVLKKEQKNKDLAGRMLQYFDWCFREGGKTASAMHYVPMPAEVVALVKASGKKSSEAIAMNKPAVFPQSGPRREVPAGPPFPTRSSGGWPLARPPSRVF